MVQTSMRAVPVVLAEPAREFGGRSWELFVGAGIGPFAKSGLDEAFGFAIGARSVGASESLAQVELKAEAAKDSGAIAGTALSRKLHRSFVGSPSRSEGLHFLSMTRSYVPSDQPARYSSCSGVSLSILMPTDSSFSLATRLSRSSGTL